MNDSAAPRMRYWAADRNSLSRHLCIQLDAWNCGSRICSCSRRVASPRRMLIGCTYFLTAPANSKSVRKYLQAYIYYGVALAFVASLANPGLHVGMVEYLKKQGEELETIRTVGHGSRFFGATCPYLSCSASFSPLQILATEAVRFCISDFPHCFLGWQWARATDAFGPC
jgi:hypothetical protein